MRRINSQTDDTAELRRMAREFMEGFNSGDVDRMMPFYGDTYVDVNLRNPVQSNEQRKAYYAQIIRRGGFHIDVHPDEILVEGNTAFVRGTIQLIPKKMGDPQRELRYL